MHKMIFSGIIFMGFLILIVSGFYTASNSIIGVTPNAAGLGTADTNFTLLSGDSIANGVIVPSCNWASDIDVPILGGIIWGAGCIAAYVAFLFQLAFTSSDIGFLAIIIGAFSAVFIYAAIRVLRGGG